MHFYSMGYAEALDLPLKTFWLMSNNINRISAEADIRRLSIMGAVNSSEGFSKAQEALQSEMGDVFGKAANTSGLPSEMEIRRGLATLKSLASKMT